MIHFENNQVWFWETEELDSILTPLQTPFSSHAKPRLIFPEEALVSNTNRIEAQWENAIVRPRYYFLTS